MIKKDFKKSSSIQTLTVATGIAPVRARRLAECTADWEFHPTLKFFVHPYRILSRFFCQLICELFTKLCFTLMSSSVFSFDKAVLK